MTYNDLFSWCPFIALVLGGVSILGFFRSRTWGFTCICATLFMQVAAWTTLLLAANVRQYGWTPDWNNILTAGLWNSVIGVVPYTVIGAVCGGVMFVLARISVREEVDEAKADAAGGKTMTHAHHT